MDKTLREHIAFLEKHLQRLNGESMENGHSLRMRNKIETEMRAAQTALEFYRRALELEIQLTKQSA